MAENESPKGSRAIIATLGCRLNQTESEAIGKHLTDAGYCVSFQPVTAADAVMTDAALVVVNTCAVTQKAEQKARRDIRLLLEKCPMARVVVTGCYAALSKAEIEAIDPRIEVMPKNEVASRVVQEGRIAMTERPPSVKLSVAKGFDTPRLHNSGGATQPPVVECARRACIETTTTQEGRNRNDGLEAASFSLFTPTFQSHSRASLKVQDGCNGNCAFCTIHIARGKSVSLSVDEAARRAQEIEANGYREVALTGVNLGQWCGSVQQPQAELLNHRSLSSEAYRSAHQPWRGDGRGLPYLLQTLLSTTNHLCFRLSSLHPDVIDEEFCSVASNKRVRPHFHLSVQSGSDRILRAMNRPYTRQAVLDAASSLRRVKDNPFLACDIITGFPGEREEDFADTVSLCRECGFAHIHAFPFSPRPGTAACTMRPCVPQAVTGRRVQVLDGVSAEQEAEYIRQCRGRVYEAIAERHRNGDGAGVFRAVTENFLHILVHITDGLSLPKQGDTIKVIMDDNGQWRPIIDGQ